MNRIREGDADLLVPSPMVVIQLVPLLFMFRQAASFATTTQSRFGAQIEHIRQQYRVNELWPFDRKLPITQLAGFMWSLPMHPTSTEGLGGGITWAWDPELCPNILKAFREDFFFVKFITCTQLKAAVGRGFASWAANSVSLSFTDVSQECAAINRLDATCPLAEVWVTASTSDERPTRSLASADDSANELDLSKGWTDALSDDETSNLGGGIAVATATPKARYASNFRFTNGVVNGVPSTDTPERGAVAASRKMIEIHGARLTFNTELCWYLDSTFCYSFHRMKTYAPDLTGDEIHWIVRGVLLFIFMMALLVAFYNVAKICCFAKTNQKAGMGNIYHAYIDALARKSLCGLCLTLALVITPPAFYIQIFLPVSVLLGPATHCRRPCLNDLTARSNEFWSACVCAGNALASYVQCWECYDFEAAATHEVGHLLGFAHPDTIGPSTLCTSKAVCGKTPGQNVYASNLLNGGRWNASTCMNPWDSVMAGVPPGSTIDDTPDGRLLQPGEARASVMKALTQHNPSVCLAQDDLDGLNVLYPSCSHTFSTPVCDKVAYNIGWVRLGVWILMPLLCCVAFLVCIFSYASHKQNKRLDQQIRTRMAHSVALQGAKMELSDLKKSSNVLKRDLEEQKLSEAERIRQEVERVLAKHSQLGRGDGLGEDSSAMFAAELEESLSRLQTPKFADERFKGGTVGYMGEKVAQRAEKAFDFLSVRLSAGVGRISKRGGGEDSSWKPGRRRPPPNANERAIAEGNEEEEVEEAMATAEDASSSPPMPMLSAIGSSSGAMVKARAIIGKSCKRLSTRAVEAQKASTQPDVGALSASASSNTHPSAI